nr:hypothetical protein BaRGS_021241 [Batillaria attramentaria]
MAGNHGNSSGASGAPSQQQQVYVYEKPVREEYILENIRQKIDKRKLMEWSRQMDRIKHQEHVDLLQMHSNFPTRIAPKADDGEELSPPAMAQESSPSCITITVNSDNEEAVPVELLPNPASPHPTGVSASLSVPAGGHDDPHLIRQVSAPAALDVSPHSPPAHHQQHDLDPVVLEEQEGFEFLESPGDANQTTKVLRKLEALNEKFPNSEGCTYTFKTLPDNAIQVTIHMAKDAKENSSKKKPKIGTSKSHDDRLYTGEPTLMKTSSVSGRMTGTEVKVTSASVSGGLAPSGQSLGSFSSRLTPRMPPLLSRSVSADTKTFTTEMLKERIQQLISANAAIVDMPMADPPRTKGRFSRQNSDSGFQSWKIGDQGSISAASLEQAGLATSVSTSKITIPNITSIPLQPIPADLEAAGRGTNLLSSVSLDTGRDKPGAHPRDLRRSVSASGVHMMVPPTIVRTFHDTDSKKDSTDLPEEVSVIPTAPSVTRPGLAEGSMAEVSLVTADGSMSIPASLPLEVINAISSASGAAGKRGDKAPIQDWEVCVRTDVQFDPWDHVFTWDGKNINNFSFVIWRLPNDWAAWCSVPKGVENRK